MAKECVFCRIVSGELPGEVVYQDESFLAFRDVSPQAPTHVLIVPKEHITSLADLTDEQEELAERLVTLARHVAQGEGIAKDGYRLVINCGPEGGQEVPHLHLHLLGGRRLSGRLG